MILTHYLDRDEAVAIADEFAMPDLVAKLNFGITLTDDRTEFLKLCASIRPHIFNSMALGQEYFAILHRRVDALPEAPRGARFPEQPCVRQVDARNLRSHARMHGWTKRNVDSYLQSRYQVTGFTKLSWRQYIEFYQRTQYPPNSERVN